jgi:hypothetical protein
MADEMTLNVTNEGIPKIDLIIKTQLDDRGSIPGRGFSFRHHIQTGSGVYPTYPRGTGGSFPGNKAAGS